MKRREFIGIFAGGAAASWPPARSNPTNSTVLHSLIPASRRLADRNRRPVLGAAVLRNLARARPRRGRRSGVERYSAEGRYDRFAAIAAAVGSRNPSVIVVNLNGFVKAFTGITATIPIVSITGDPIAGGLITNLARPGGNLTGVSINAGIEIGSKRLQILKEVIPSAAKVAYLLSGGWSGGTISTYRETGQRLGIALTENFLPEVDEVQLRHTFAEMAQQRFDAAIVDEGGSFLAQRALIAELAEKYRLPVIYPYRDYVDLGGLISYSPRARRTRPASCQRRASDPGRDQTRRHSVLSTQ
jgi:putative tryptophan/tyrosine transport system substrate-binding protein